MSVTFHELGPTEREVRCRCARCGTVCDGVVQHLVMDPQTGERTIWSPDPAPTLAMLGWLSEFGTNFCSKGCHDWYAYAEKSAGVSAPVQKIADAGYARKMYGEPAPKSAAK